MTTLTDRLPAASSRRTAALTLVAAVAVAIIAAQIIAAAAVAAGATAFPPLMILVFGPFAAVGVLGAYFGWRVVRRIARLPRRVLQVLVPVVLAVSFVPDVVLLTTGFIPGSTTTGTVALMLMHLVVAGVAVPVSQRLAPV
ncbi:MAG: DUF6069 family protein [Pseudolysinimonas sp.]